jgi:hypothetical protein
MARVKKSDVIVPEWRKGVRVLDEFPIPGKRYPVREGYWLKVKGRTGEFKVMRIDEWPDGRVEVLTWWNSSRKSQRPNVGFYTLDLGKVAITRVGL